MRCFMLVSKDSHGVCDDWDDARDVNERRSHLLPLIVTLDRERPSPGLHLLGAAVGGAEIQLLVECEHSRRQVGEQALQIGLGLGERGLVALHPCVRFGELEGHPVE